MRKLRTFGVMIGLALAAMMATGSAQSAPFVGKITMVTGYGLPIPVGVPWQGFGAANPVANGTNPPSISFTANNFDIQTSGVAYPPQPTSYPFITSSTFLTAALPAGTLAANAGPGTIEFCGGNTTHLCGVNANPPPQHGERSGWVRVTAGPNQFGGVLPLLNLGPDGAGFRNRAHIQSGTGKLVGTFAFNMAPFGNNTTFNDVGTEIFSHTTLGFTVPLTAHLQGMPWTTGQVKASDAFGVVSSVQTATGYDNRTASGNNGAIQLVAAGLYHVGGLTADDGTVMTTMKLNFVPEPSSENLLTAGLIALPLLYIAGGVVGLPLLRRRQGAEN